MRKWKIAFAAVAVAVLVSASLSFGRATFARRHRRGGDAQSRRARHARPGGQIVKKNIPIYLDYSARTESIRNIALQAKVPGYIRQQHVPDGADVKEGDLLYTIDPRDLQAALDQAKAQVQRVGSSRLCASQSRPRNRAAKSGWLAKDNFDQRTSASRQAEASLAMDQAAVTTAELNLGYTEIRAPFAGRLGRNQAPVGTLVSVAGAPLNTLVQLDPIYVTFNPSETDLVEIEKARAGGTVAADILLPGETQARHKGELTFIDNASIARPARSLHAPPSQHQSRLAARPICSHPAVHQDRTRYADGAADRVGIQPARQIRLCHRQRQQGRAASGFARPHRWRPRRGAERRRGGRPGDHRQSAEDRPWRGSTTLAAIARNFLARASRGLQMTVAARLMLSAKTAVLKKNDMTA